MKTNKILVTMALAQSLILCSCGKKEEKANTEVQEVKKAELVKVSFVEKKQVEREIVCTSVLEGWETVNVSPSLTGIINKIYKDVGSNVSKGELLVTMDETQLNTSKLAFANLEVEMKRMEALISGGNVTQQTYDATKLKYDQAKEDLAFKQKNTYVRSEISGVVSAKNYENGEFYNAQRGVLTITQINVLKALVSIPESYFPTIKKGMKMDFTSDIYTGKTFQGIIDVVYPTVDAGTHTFQAKVKILNNKSELRPGMYMKTVLGVGKSDAILVPYMSVLKMAGANTRYLFLVKDGKAKRVEVKLGQRFDELTEVISDEIQPNDMIVVSGQSRLVDGVDVEIVTDSETEADNIASQVASEDMAKADEKKCCAKDSSKVCDKKDSTKVCDKKSTDVKSDTKADDKKNDVTNKK